VAQEPGISVWVVVVLEETSVELMGDMYILFTSLYQGAAAHVQGIRSSRPSLVV
jgi:hypothetical protein